jgi:phage-related protein
MSSTAAHLLISITYALMSCIWVGAKFEVTEGAGVLEVVEDNAGGTYRAIYTVKFEEAVFVLHCFQKKSKRGIATPKGDMDIIRARLKIAEALAKEMRDAQKDH